MPLRRTPQARELDRRIVSLAVPAFLALVAEPLFLAADAAIVGHLGTTPLAGLGVASVLLRACVGLCIFLAYGTTAAVARQLGAGRRRAAIAQGVDGLWLALLLGVVIAAAGVPLSDRLVALFDTSTGVADQATTYLRLSFLGVPAMLVVLASTGVLRGLLDTTTPLVVEVAANVLNVALNVLLVYGAGLGIAGSALGTDVAQLGSAVVLAAVVVRLARREGAPLRPHAPGVRRSARTGAPLVVRTLTLQLCLLVTTWAAADLGTLAVATHQVAQTVWAFLANALDAVAIAAQAITGGMLGAGDRGRTRETTRRIIGFGVLSGIVTGVCLALAAPLLGGVFTQDAEVRSLLGKVLLVAAVFQPLAGVVFVLDGVLIGAGDGRYLAAGGTAVTVLFVPAVLAVVAFVPGPVSGLLALWAVFGVVFIGGRAVVLVTRARSDRWMIVGATTERARTVEE